MEEREKALREKLESARNLKALGLSIEQISAALYLSPEEAASL
jgi:predicted transposase YdaD